jgi:putative CocE/NonD family hydrolase
VLVYTSAPLPGPIEVIGDMSARLHVSSDAVDTDFTVALVDVFPDGAANLIQDGILRMGVREPDRGRQLLEPGRVYEVEIDLWAIAYRISAGHRLRVEISSSEFDRYDRNLNTAALPGESSDMVVAHQTVFHDAARPSHVSVPVRPAVGR